MLEELEHQEKDEMRMYFPVLCLVKCIQKIKSSYVNDCMHLVMTMVRC